MHRHEKTGNRSLFALPERGHPERRMGVIGYGLLASAVAFTSVFAITDSRTPTRERETAPAASVPDRAPSGAEADGEGEVPVPSSEAKVSSVFSDDAQEGYVPSYFDGHGGVAGVPFTEEQRQALMAEAVSRGMTREAAHVLAYGEGGEAWERGVTRVHDTVYRQITPEERRVVAASVPAGTADVVEQPSRGRQDQAARPGRSGLTSAGKGQESGKGRPSTKGGPTKKKPAPKQGEKRSLVDTLEAGVKSMLPDPVEDLLSPFSPFSLFLGDLSMDGEVELEVSKPDPATNTVTVTGAVLVTENVKVTVEAEVPVEESASGEGEPCTITTTVENPETGVVAVENTVVVHDSEDVSQAAVSETVGAILEATGVPAEELAGTPDLGQG